MNKLTSKFYLVGIKGTGMSSLALILKDMNNDVVGSDNSTYYFTEDNLINKNIKYYEFNKNNITGDHYYIIGNAYNYDNIEVKEIVDKKYEYMYYSDFIESYFDKKIGISGTHGKTTTTSICAKFLEDFNISYLIGNGEGKGCLNYNYFLFEACEYKNNFHKYSYDYLIINNIDYDHVDFFKDIDEVVESFQEASYNALNIIINNDDENARKISHVNKITYGMRYDSDYVIADVKEYRDGFLVRVISKYNDDLLKVPLVGLHNVYNVVASYVLVKELGLDVNIQSKLYEYKLPKKRMEESIINGNIIIDDYAHHPREIKALLNAVKQKYKEYKNDIIVVFQPHTYSRTIKLKDEFKDLFTDVTLYLAKTYSSAREEENKDLDNVVKKIFSNAIDYDEGTIEYLKKVKNKIIIFLGAGIIANDIKKMISNI